MTTAQHVIAHGSAVTNPKYKNKPRHVKVPADRPGIVIFLHGVNDPGATYEKVESGICQGLNWRLNRKDLKAGDYGAAWKAAQKTQADAAKSGAKVPDSAKTVLNDPDTYLYKRLEDTLTNSVFIPFYWGYRAADGEVAKDEQGHPVKLRTQHQDTKGNRLDAHFAKEGGYFDNATNNIPDMYGEGFKVGAKEWAAGKLADNYTYIGTSPKRLYFVLAAHRLATLIREIRSANPGQGTGDDTVTVIGHSQGTIITMLAQAILAKEGCRPADAIVMVDSPYAVWEADSESQTSQAKLKTLANIVEAVTRAKHTTPPLAELVCSRSNPKHRGRTGPKWSPTKGIRPLGPGGADADFAERDNRGRVHMYFCTDDQVVALDNIRGIGTYGLPDSVTTIALGSGSWGKSVEVPAMDAFRRNQARFAFYQRWWTKLKRDGKVVPVGLPPQTITIRTKEEPRYPGSGIAAAASQHPYRNLTSSAPRDGSNERWVNGEEITPHYAPNLFGTETRGSDGNTSGKVPVDAVGVDVALGNPRASFQQQVVTGIPASIRAQIGSTPGADAKANVVKQWFNNQNPDENDQTSNVFTPDGGVNFLRDETPNEIRKRLTGIDATDNNYHSGILNDSANIRAVAAMDVAIGQARTLDDPGWRAALAALADWRTDWSTVPANVRAIYTGKFTDHARQVANATFKYYSGGEFPGEALVPRHWPPLVVSQTTDERSDGKNDPGIVG
ncbi:T6SS effector phospholipase Tle3 domain-containing protein [Paraburkholderia graminis]|uniref:T6SS effector phospholipase Tle3 domain-containing protein n=1 Tax=Paraburkholderia graminis TaxID=60548 RepID=UPI0038BACD31